MGRASALLCLPGQRNLLHCQDSQKLNLQSTQSHRCDHPTMGTRSRGASLAEEHQTQHCQDLQRHHPSSFTPLKQEEQELLLCNIRAHSQLPGLACFTTKGGILWGFSYSLW